MLIFLDSFDHYNTAQITQKWDTAGTDTVINITGGVPRTGRGCLQIRSAAFGPTKIFQNTHNFLAACAWNSDQAGSVFLFQNFSVDVGFNATCVLVRVNADRSVSAVKGPNGGNAVLGTSATGLVQFNTYNSIAMRATISATVGTVDIWVNGALVLSLSGVNTSHSNGNPTVVNGCTLMGPGGLPNCFIDDVYMLDCGTAPNDTFEGACRIFAEVPFENSTPLQWTPLSGTNWDNVEEIPPDGDTSYNSAAAVGLTDQYNHDDAGIPANSQIKAVQHVMDLRLDTGSRSVSSAMAGVVASLAFPLTSTYVMYTTPYDTNPATVANWDGATDFPLAAGPSVTL